MTLLAAYAHVALRRDINALNYGFWAQLCDEEVIRRQVPNTTETNAHGTLPLLEYFRITERVHSPHSTMRTLSREGLLEEWKRQCGVNESERRTVRGCLHLCSNGFLLPYAHAILILLTRDLSKGG